MTKQNNRETFNNRRSMKNSKRLILIGFISLLLFSCAKDIIVDPPNSLRGFYVGEYFLKAAASSQNPTTRKSAIDFTFTDVQIFGDFVYPTEEDRIFCDFRGTYSLEGQLDLNSVQVANQKCIEGEIPSGVYSVEWTLVDEGNDTLRLFQRIPPPVDEERTLILEKQPDNPQ